ncbi:hypothetical protein KAR91_27160 [Candidatus Pacearchaeota archaeon]|nr:hypothetical protein [Candidatus Pacearchaeota archaeon]
MFILAHFTDEGVPALSLSPIVKIRKVSDGSIIVAGDTMDEVGDGAYSYDFTGYDKDIDYSVRCDGGATLQGSERYTWGGNDSFMTDIREEIDERSTEIALIRRILNNRLEIDEGNSKLIIYADDDVTPLLEWPITDKDGSSIDLVAGPPSNRGARTL